MGWRAQPTADVTGSPDSRGAIVASRSWWRRVEAPTWALAVAVYAGWGLTTWYYHALPWWLVLPLGAWFVCWQGSLQHEALHGHPTRRAWLNMLVAFPPLWLWLPYPLYRESHLAHHADARLTSPLDDPESYYVTVEAWARFGALRRALLRARNTLLGRLVLGPAFAYAELAAGEVRRLGAGDSTQTAIDFYRAAGFSEDALAQYQSRFGMFGRFVSRPPDGFRRLRDSDRIQIGTYLWEVIVGRGHSPEHACLYCAELNIIISGDQILPTISSNISLWPTEPDADPLDDWLNSCRTLRERFPADALVLPAHGKPFRGAHARLDELIVEHQCGLEKLVRLCAEPKSAIEVFPALFKSRISDSNLMMATGEALAHLQYLVKRGTLAVEADSDRVRRYHVA